MCQNVYRTYVCVAIISQTNSRFLLSDRPHNSVGVSNFCEYYNVCSV